MYRADLLNQNQVQMNSENNSFTVTVIIPVFNRSGELARALEALVAQSDPDFEVIVCDDGSSEDISAVTQSYSDKLRMQLLRIDNSGGPARPRNVAAVAAQSQWLSFLDSDDWWFPNRMARIKVELDGSHEIVYHQLQINRADKNSQTRPAHGSLLGAPLSVSDPLLHMIRFGNPLPTSATTVRRQLMLDIEGFDESRALASVEDFDAWLRLCSRGARLKFIPETLGVYWVGADQISTFNMQQYERQQNLFTRQIGLLPKQYQARAQSNFSYLLGSYALDLGLPGAAEHFRRISLFLEPVRWLKAQIKLLRFHFHSIIT